MSREVFEYFVDSTELEPFYSELMGRPGLGTRPSKKLRPNGSRASRVAHCDANRDLHSTNRPVDPSEVAVGETPDDAKPIVTQPSESVFAPTVFQRATPDGETDSPSQSEWATRVRRFVSVHALGQYVYCSRSAILALEKSSEQDVDELLPRLTYLPNFHLQEIEEALALRLRATGVAIVYGIAIWGAMMWGLSQGERIVFSLAFLLGMIHAGWFCSLATDIVQLVLRRRAALSATEMELDLGTHGIQSVNWWSLLQAKFEPVNYQRPFRHPEYPLEGCPWRVLERGSTRIPVIRAGGECLGPASGELFPKYMIRLTAYALLLESTTHAEVPFGVVFPMDSPKGLALRITPALREKTLRSLDEFAMKLRDSQEHGVEPRPPENRRRCASCEYGQPVEINASGIEAARKSGSRLLVLQNGNLKAFHCQCGDRFGSAPPHANSIKLGLSAALD